MKWKREIGGGGAKTAQRLLHNGFRKPAGFLRRAWYSHLGREKSRPAVERLFGLRYASHSYTRGGDGESKAFVKVVFRTACSLSKEEKC